MGRLQIVESKRSDTHEVALGLVEEDGVKYDIELFRSLNAPEGNFLASNVKVDDKEIWHFKKTGYKGICAVTEVGDKVVFYFLSYDRKLEWVITINCLKSLQVIEGEFVTSLDVNEAISLKRLVASKLGSVVKFSPAENKVLGYLLSEQKKKEDSMRLERLRLKEEKRDRIMSREIISAYTETGAGRFGRPVVGEEWHCLSSGTFVVLVESFDEGTGKCGPAIEAFAIKKGKGGRPEKENAVMVTDERPPVRRIPDVKASAVFVFDINGAFRSVPVYKTMDEIRQARANGLNGGSLVTSEDRKDEKGRYTIFAVSDPEIKTMGQFSPL